MSEYLKSERLLLCNKADEINEFSSKVFLVKVQNSCPMVYYLVLGDIQGCDVKIKGAAANSVSLASAVICRLKSQSIALGFPPYFKI